MSWFIAFAFLWSAKNEKFPIKLNCHDERKGRKVEKGSQNAKRQNHKKNFVNFLSSGGYDWTTINVNWRWKLKLWKLVLTVFCLVDQNITHHRTNEWTTQTSQNHLRYLDVVIHSYLIYFIHLFIYRSSWIDKTNNSRSFFHFNQISNVVSIIYCKNIFSSCSFNRLCCSLGVIPDAFYKWKFIKVFLSICNHTQNRKLEFIIVSFFYYHISHIACSSFWRRYCDVKWRNSRNSLTHLSSSRLIWEKAILPAFFNIVISISILKLDRSMMWNILKRQRTQLSSPGRRHHHHSRKCKRSKWIVWKFENHYKGFMNAMCNMYCANCTHITHSGLKISRTLSTNFSTFIKFLFVYQAEMRLIFSHYLLSVLSTMTPR